MIGNRLWRSITNDSTRQVAVQFGNTQPWEANATGFVGASNIHYLVFHLDGTDFLDDLRANSIMKVSTGGRVIGEYAIGGAGLALAKVVDCQRIVEKAIDPFASPRK